MAILAVLGVLTVGFWLLILWADRSRSGKIAFLVALLIPLNAMRELGSTYTPYLRGGLIRLIGTSGVTVILGAIVIGCVIFLFKGGLQSIYRAAFALGVILAPLIVMTVFQDIQRARHYNTAGYLDKAGARPQGKTGPRRVVWIIFDEMDERITFEKQPPVVKMPAFARLRETAISASAAYSPTASTLSSLPSLINGRFVETVRPVTSDDLRMVYAGAEGELRWGDEPNVFSAARAMGYDTALVGWYHPYCRVLNRDLTSCWWAAMPMQYDSVGRTFGDAVPRYLRSLFETSLLSPFGQSLATQEMGHRIQALVEQSLRVVADPSLSLVFLHVQPPHAPHAYNREKHDFSLANSPVSGYLDGLELADSILGQIRAAMEEKSLWDSTDVLVSADHSYRSPKAYDGHVRDRRVPFLLKLAGKNDAMVYTKTFNTVISAQLVQAILRNAIVSNKDAVAEIDRWRTPFQGF